MKITPKLKWINWQREDSKLFGNNIKYFMGTLRPPSMLMKVLHGIENYVQSEIYAIIKREISNVNWIHFPPNQSEERKF